MIRTLGLCAAVAMSVLAAPQAHGVIVGFEAESGTPGTVAGETFNTIADGSALGGFYVTVSGDGGGSAAGELTYSVNLAADDYDLWIKVLAPSADDDSFFAPSDDGALTSGGNDFEDPPGVTVNNLANNVSDGQYTWMLVNGNAGGAGDYTVSSGGPFSLVINGREDGLQIDALAFVSASEGFTGIGEGGDTIATAGEAAQLDAAVLAASATAPEPSTFALAALSLFGLAAMRRRRS